MLDFFTNLLTPVFIGLGILNPAPAIQPQIETNVLQQEVIELREKIQELEKENTEEVEVELDIETTDSTEQKTLPKVTNKPVENIVPDTEEEVVEIPVASIDEDIFDGEAKCGLADKQDYELTPIDNLCENGNPTEVIQYKKDKYIWKCETSEDSTNCKANRKANGKCGDVSDSNSILQKEYDKSILCEDGILTNLNEENGETIYFCNGTQEGTLNARCSVFIEIDGDCGPLHREDLSYFSLEENEEACNSGEIDFISTENNRFNWKCIGVNGGEDDICYADKISTQNNTQNDNTSCVRFPCAASA